jgi:putative transposase
VAKKALFLYKGFDQETRRERRSAMKMEVSVPEVLELIKEVQRSPESLFEMIRINLKESVGEYLSELMKIELHHFLGRKRYERRRGCSNHRNGSYGRHFTLKGIGEVGVKVPRDREGAYKTEIIPRSKQYEDELRQDMCAMYLAGISTRALSLMSERLIGRKISPMEISKASNALNEAVEQWRQRDLSGESFKYLFVDGVTFPMRINGSVERVPVLVMIGVTQKGRRMVLGLQAGDKESASSWREFFKDLKRRGLKAELVVLGVMDGLPGLERVFYEEFPKAVIQRCQIHVARNVLAKVPRKLKETIADEIRSIFYASSRSKAMEFFHTFKGKWERELPSAVRCLENSLEACLKYLNFPEEEWVCLRTTNVVERINKEFKRRTKPMEILAGERSCYTLLAFVCLKMELQWKSKPIGKVPTNLPFFKRLVENNFTQES